MISSYVGENAEFERQYLAGELEVELTPQVSQKIMGWFILWGGHYFHQYYEYVDPIVY